MNILCDIEQLKIKHLGFLKAEIFNEVRDYYSEQAQYISEKVIQEIINYCNDIKFDLSEAEFKIAFKMIVRLREAIYWDGMFQNKNDGYNTFYKDLNFKGDYLSPWVNDNSKIDIVELNKLISDYLSLKWFSSPTFEWFIINSYLRYCIQKNRISIFYDSGLFNGISVAMSSNNVKKYYILSFLFKVAGLSFSYFFWSLVLSWAFNISWILTGSILSIFIALSFIYKHVKCNKKLVKPLAELIKLKYLVSGKTWSPSVVIDKINSISSIYHIQELSPLFSKIINRDKNIFNATF